MEKYYTPKIEELFVGYEIELAEIKLCNNGDIELTGEFKKYSVTPLFIYDFESWKKDCCRTYYLTEEQLVSQGWVIIEPDEFLIILKKDINKYEYYELLLDKKEHRISISYLNNSPNITFSIDECVFDGLCPSINEFKKICKLLNIK